MIAFSPTSVYFKYPEFSPLRPATEYDELNGRTFETYETAVSLGEAITGIVKALSVNQACATAYFS